MDDQSSATHGPFYITNILEVEHAEVKEQGGNVCGGGVSVFYSHMLQLLFFSYSQGKEASYCRSLRYNRLCPKITIVNSNWVEVVSI